MHIALPAKDSPDYQKAFADVLEKVVKRKTSYYPDEYKDRIGKSYNDYVAARQMSVFEYLEGYVGQTYSDAAAQETAVEEAASQELADEEAVIQESTSGGAAAIEEDGQ